MHARLSGSAPLSPWPSGGMSQMPGLEASRHGHAITGQQVPGSAPALNSRPSFISEEELRSERERWRQTCMHEVWNLENAAFERINSQLEEATSKLSEEVTREVMRHIEEERSQRIVAINEVRAALRETPDSEALASLRRDVQAVQATASEVARSQLRQQPGGSETGEAVEAQAAVRALRSELDMRTAQQQASSSSLEARFQECRLQISSMEAAIADLRSEIGQQRERQDLQNMAAITELRQEFGGVQLAQQQVLADQAAKGSIEAKRSLQELSLETQRELQELKVAVTARQEEIEVLQHQYRDISSAVRLEGASQTEVASLGHRLQLAEKQLALAPTSSSEALIKEQLGTAQNELQRLSLGMAEERNDRCKSLSEVNRLMESLSRATSASLDQTEQRLASKISAVSSTAQTPTIEASQRSVFLDFNKGVSEGYPTSASITAALDQSQNPAMGSSFAKLVGEVEAELRVELNKIQRSASETRAELLREVTVRCATTEARCGTIEADLKAKINSVADDMLPRLAKLEGAQLPSRLQNLEQEVKRNSLLLTEKAAAERQRVDQSPFRQRHSVETSLHQHPEQRQASLLQGNAVARQASIVSPGAPLRAAAASAASQAPASETIEQLVASFTKVLSEKIEKEGIEQLGTNKGRNSEMALGSLHDASSSTPSEPGAGSGSNSNVPQLSSDLKHNLHGIIQAVSRTLGASGGGSCGGESTSPRSAGKQVAGVARPATVTSGCKSLPSGGEPPPRMQMRPNSSASGFATSPKPPAEQQQDQEKLAGSCTSPPAPPPPSPHPRATPNTPNPVHSSQSRGRNAGMCSVQAPQGYTRSAGPGLAHSAGRQLGFGTAVSPNRLQSTGPIASHASQPLRAGSTPGHVTQGGCYLATSRGAQANAGMQAVSTRVRSHDYKPQTKLPM